MGHHPDEIFGTNLLDHVHPEGFAHVLGENERALSEEGLARNKAEYRFRRRS